jgi:sec-independent protein translocase protein TatB
MLGVGPLELLLIGVVALIVIGPKELPGLMRKVGQFAGQIRRMGQDFQRELNKTTGLNEIRNLRDSVTQPLKATADAIRKEFNTTTASGEVKPSGALKPADPKVESVVDEIKAAAGMTKPLPLTPAAAAAQKAAEAGEVQAVVKAPAKTGAAMTPLTDPKAPVKAAKAPVKAAKAPARIKAPAESTVEATEIEPVKAARKPRAAKAIESPAPVEAIAPKATAKKAKAAPAEAAPEPVAAKKPVPTRRTKAATAETVVAKPSPKKRATPKAAS